MKISVFVQNRKKKEMEIFVFCVITFEPILSKTCLAPQNDRQNLVFLKDMKVVVKKMTRNHRKMIKKTPADSLLCPLHRILFLPLVFIPLCRECDRAGAAGARTCRSLGYHLLQPLIFGPLVLCIAICYVHPLILRFRVLFYKTSNRLHQQILIVPTKIFDILVPMRSCYSQACRPWVCRVCHGTPRFWQIS